MLARGSSRALGAAGRAAWAATAGRALSSSLPQEAAGQRAELPAFDYTPPPYTGPGKAEVLALRKQFLSPGNL